MTPIRRWRIEAGEWCPVLFVILALLAVFPMRFLVMLLLPEAAIYNRHPLYKIHNFWRFN